MRVGAIDCGTNSIRLLIADIDDGGRLTDVVRTMQVVRLGQGVDATGLLADEALARTFTAAEDYAGLLREHGAASLRFVATSATRDARNRQVFVDGVRARLGVEPEVISGGEEAELSFSGAASVLAAADDEQVLVVDLGGGSTEFVLGTGAGVRAARSTDMGCVRFTERYLRSDPPTAAEIAAAEQEINACIDQVLRDVPLKDTDRLVGVAGSITTVTAHALGLSEYEPGVIHGAALDAAKTRQACTSLLEMSRAERAALPYMHPGRVDVIGAGALIWRTINDRVGELTGGRVNGATASEHDILDGIALSAAQPRSAAS
ncbi:Ppx/GppA phosphatase [Arthrobacter crystallopoietes BAB-32]|uniref:Ppx/GppA phosphatase n=1 Tax=Arthrobacter crystallopoietes BAB-32 TaxID=1246476 RepID=N1UPP3_9MICC|nr:Ppx/GppA phosphatase family protein [Arthrobacter crystallopoietes]EMY32361.1 Ppx/GppA phosphatase [Arthrobacter crystallopoietes BAB-32]